MSDFEERLRSALDGIELTEQEGRYLSWLARMDLETVETFAGLFEKCRADRPVGRWIMHDDEVLGLSCECSVCHIETVGDSPYCPRCGVRMEERSCRNCCHVCIDDNGEWRDDPCGCVKWEAKK